MHPDTSVPSAARSVPTVPPALGQRVRVLIVDCDPRVRQSLSGLIALRDDVEIVAACGDSIAALSEIEAVSPDVVIVDPRLPDVDAGLRLLADIRERFPRVRLIATSVSSAIEASAVATGVRFVAKSGNPEGFIHAILDAQPEQVPLVDSGTRTAD